jgi:HAMP domain-containing protein
MDDIAVLLPPNKPESTDISGNGEISKSKTGRRLAENSSEDRSRLILAGMVAFRDGDFSVRLPTNWLGTDGMTAEVFNQTIAQKQRISSAITRLSTAVGIEGRLKQRMTLPGALGGWAEDADSINTLIDDLVRPTTEIARTIGAVDKGDLGQSMELEVDGRALKGEFLRSAKLVNTMIEQLSVFTSEVTRVAREVGTEG